ncbi:hypothetical protein NDR89_18320 [Cupriavidus gilardii]|uniref:Uncharacterized protein n=1 Tax=Cupriavidus gilardii TaxID=82541 RepID=A0ABY4VV30_9BURK|nr:hypothetical protein [Cupriavidus gilardii]USE78615.1 hypothetical protein NDR89_18320 [Cupriavidus gilardii]
MARTYSACLSTVANRGEPPVQFLDELVDWALEAPDEIFSERPGADIYSHMESVLGPWDGLLHRKSVMLEVLRVLGGYESSWRWEEGRHKKKGEVNTPCTEEAGIFQCSGNSMGFDSSLVALFEQASGIARDCDVFRAVTKANHRFAIEYCARLLRFTTAHHGPIKEHKIDKWVRRDAVAEFQSYLVMQNR